jgi:Fe-S-cluster containining protein
MLEVYTKCKNLTPDLRCGDYENRPALCEDYDPRDCVKTDPKGDEKRTFYTAKDFLDYLEEIGESYDPREEAKRRKEEE